VPLLGARDVVVEERHVEVAAQATASVSALKRWSSTSRKRFIQASLNGYLSESSEPPLGK
jgi:hypothetical protein